MEYPKEVQDEIISIIEKISAGISLDDREVIMLFHYARNKDNPEYQFVKDYFTAKNKKKKRGSLVSTKHSKSKGKPKREEKTA